MNTKSIIYKDKREQWFWGSIVLKMVAYPQIGILFKILKNWLNLKLPHIQKFEESFMFLLANSSRILVVLESSSLIPHPREATLYYSSYLNLNKGICSKSILSPKNTNKWTNISIKVLVMLKFRRGAYLTKITSKWEKS